MGTVVLEGLGPLDKPKSAISTNLKIPINVTVDSDGLNSHSTSKNAYFWLCG